MARPETFRFEPQGDYRTLVADVPFFRAGLPKVVRKEDVRNQHEALIHPLARAADLDLVSTSGSTGMPLRFYECAFDRQIFKECYNRAYLFFPSLAYKAVTISDFEYSDKEDAPYSSLSYAHPRFQRATHHLFRFLSSRDSCDVLTERLWREAPGLLEGYPSAIYLTARMLLKQKRALESVEVISPCGEYLRDCERPVLQEAFPNAIICTRYGANELGPMAWECPLCREHHFNADHYAFHAIEGGKLAISKRYISGFQLAHYDVGDRIQPLGLGGCRIELPTVRVLEGRRDDILVDAAGEPLPIMPYQLGDIPELIQWQIVQQKDLSLTLHAIVEETSTALAKTLEERVRRDLGGTELPLEVRFVRSIDATSKLKRIVSLVEDGVP